MSTDSATPHATTGLVRGVFAGPIRALRSPRTPAGDATSWRSAILKSPASGAIAVRETGLEGDRQKETRHHGGPTKAVLIYGAEHYATTWHPQMSQHAEAHEHALRAMSGAVDASAWGAGAFGENLTIDGLVEATVCLGDLWQVGSCHLRITEPRAPCGTLTRRWMRPELLGDVQRTAAAGWYNAVEREGAVAVGDTAMLVERMQDEWTLERVFRMLEARSASRAELRRLHDAECTHDGLRERLTRRLATPGRSHE